jgi:dCMP deaminase
MKKEERMKRREFLEARPEWDETWMNIAKEMSRRSVCLYYGIGAVIARDKRLLSLGYNGPVSGDPHCREVGCAKEIKKGKKTFRLPPGSGLCRGSHAEINAIINAANLGVPINESTLYITWRPCLDCSKHIVNAGIKRVIYIHDYDGDLEAIKLLERRRVELIKFR